MTTSQKTISAEPYHRFFAAREAALRCISHALESAEDVRIATAYFEGSGFQVLQETLQGKRIRLLVGRKEGGADSLREVINEFVQELSYGPLDSRSRAMQQMLEALEKGWMTVVVGETLPSDAPWMDARYLYHHAKLYIADEQTVVVTSANFSGHGLCRSREAGITINDPEDVAFFVHRFDKYFARARSITDQLIEILRAWLQAYDPYTIYARALCWNCTDCHMMRFRPSYHLWRNTKRALHQACCDHCWNIKAPS